MKIDRRKFISAAAALTPVLAASPAQAACPATPPHFNLNRRAPALGDLTRGRRPNILLVLTDQERWPGNLPPTLVRPNFDRLRAHAVSFDHFFCAYPLCAPSRASIFSGLYPHQTGVTANLGIFDGKSQLSKRAPHLGSVAVSAGYRIGYKGKWDISRGPTSAWNNKDRGRAGDYSFEGHCGKLPDQEMGWASDATITEEACAWLREQDRARPWFLCCSIINPHDICHPGLKPDASVRPDVVLPPTLHEDLAGKPSDQLRRRNRHDVRNDYASYTDDDWRRFLSFYYDLIESTDRLLGRLLDTLADTGAADDTIVIYTSDHGEMGGGHGMHGKYELYEEAARVPLLISHSALTAGSCSSFESNVSVAPTLAALIGADWPGPTAGNDLSPFLLDPATPGRDVTFFEHENRVNYGVYRDMNAARCIRTERWKLVRTFLDVKDGELYDLENDPGEATNLFHDTEHAGIRREFEERLSGWQRETGDHKFLGG